MARGTYVFTCSLAMHQDKKETEDHLEESVTFHHTACFAEWEATFEYEGALS